MQIVHPCLELHAPNVRFRQEQIDRVKACTGVVRVEGGDPSPDGTFGFVRVTFADDEVMEKYMVGAGLGTS